MDKNQAYTHLICAAQNMKNIAIKRANIDKNVHNNTKIINIFIKIMIKLKIKAKENLTFFQMGGFVNNLTHTLV